MNRHRRATLSSLGLILIGILSPSFLRAGPPSIISIQLAWSGNGRETGFGIDRANRSSGPWRTVARVPGWQTTYVDLGLRRSTTYYYRVWAYNAAGDSGYSNIATIQTSGSARAPAPTPAAPLATALIRNGRRASVTFLGATACRYSLEYKNSLTDAVWTALPGTVNGSGSAVTLADSNAPSGSRFYRIQAQPAP